MNPVFRPRAASISLGQELARARVRARLTQEELARRLRVARTTVQRVESGSMPRPRLLDQWCALCGVEIVAVPAVRQSSPG